MTGFLHLQQSIGVLHMSRGDDVHFSHKLEYPGIEGPGEENRYPNAGFQSTVLTP